MHTDQGHRQRVKKRFLAEGLDNFDEVHALELMLFYAVAQKDTKPLARALLDHFGSFDAVLEATVEELKCVAGVGDSVATYLSLLGQLERYRKDRRESKHQIMHDLETYGEYLLARLSGRRNETVCMLCLDAKHKLLACKLIGEGDVNSVNIPVRRMVELALATNASQVILAHNHPGGNALPSHADVMTTKAFAQALRPLGILLVDHVVVAEGDYVSMRQSRLYLPEAL